MVFFVCEHCNETVKKNQVDKHVLKCRNCYAVTCVDCSQSFYGNDYITHTVCVTEAEKYEKTLYKPKNNIKRNPQEIWNNLIDTATNSDNIKKAPNQIKQYLSRIKELTNVPRNKKKFINFSKNSLKLYNDLLLENIWSYLDGFRCLTDGSNGDGNDLDNGCGNDKDSGGLEEDRVEESKKDGVVIDDTLPHVSLETMDDKDVIDKDTRKTKKNKDKKKVKKDKRKVEDIECVVEEETPTVVIDQPIEVIENDNHRDDNDDDSNQKKIKKNKKDKKRSKRKLDQIN
jgi:hypothetical protein